MQKIVFSLVLFSMGFVQAQTSPTPYTARFREYGTTKISGTLEPFSREGFKACSSQGQIFEGQFQEGTTSYSTEKLFDPGSGTQYTINLGNRTASSQPANRKPFRTPTASPLGSEIVNNIATTVYPITNGHSSTPDGKLWVADGTNIVVKIFINLPDQQTYGYELSDVKIGQEPDSHYFKLPENIRVSH